MKPAVALILVFLNSFAVCCSTENNPATNINSQGSLVGVNHNGCSGLEKIINEDDYLKSFYISEDTLFLKIHFTANCCPEFIDSAYVENNFIQIFLYDNLVGCNCICEYEDDFKFIYPFKGKTKIEFWKASKVNPEFDLSFITYIDIP